MNKYYKKYVVKQSVKRTSSKQNIKINPFACEIVF